MVQTITNPQNLMKIRKCPNNKNINKDLIFKIHKLSKPIYPLANLALACPRPSPVASAPPRLLDEVEIFLPAPTAIERAKRRQMAAVGKSQIPLLFSPTEISADVLDVARSLRMQMRFRSPCRHSARRRRRRRREEIGRFSGLG